MKIDVLLTDDHTLVREGLAALLATEPDIRVVGQADNGRDAVDLAVALRPQVVVLDIAMPGLNGIDAAALLAKRLPEVRVIALSMHTDRRYVQRMREAGAIGYVLKNCASRELAAAIRSAVRGQAYFSPGLDTNGAGEDQTEPLTRREREVTQLIAEGAKTSEIAERLHISVKTVESHRRNIMDKLGIDNVAALIKFALREGLTSLDP